MKSHAFTLIELLVVVLIIGILSAIALPQYEKAVMKSRTAEVKTMMRAMANGTNLCFLENGSGASECNALSRGEFPNFEAPSALLYDDDCPDGYHHGTGQSLQCHQRLRDG